MLQKVVIGGRQKRRREEKAAGKNLNWLFYVLCVYAGMRVYQLLFLYLVFRYVFLFD